MPIVNNRLTNEQNKEPGFHLISYAAKLIVNDNCGIMGNMGEIWGNFDISKISTFKKGN